MEAEKRDCEVGLIFFVIESIGFIVHFFLIIALVIFSSRLFQIQKEKGFCFWLFIFSGADCIP